MRPKPAETGAVRTAVRFLFLFLRLRKKNLIFNDLASCVYAYATEEVSANVKTMSVLRMSVRTLLKEFVRLIVRGNYSDERVLSCVATICRVPGLLVFSARLLVCRERDKVVLRRTGKSPTRDFGYARTYFGPEIKNKKAHK